MIRTYIAEFNRVNGDDIRDAAEYIAANGVNVTFLPHKTSLALERPKHIDWKNFKKIIRSVLQKRNGSALIFSQMTGNAYIMKNNISPKVLTYKPLQRLAVFNKPLKNSTPGL